MALAETAALVASLELQDKFSKTAAKFDSTVAKMDSRTRSLERIGENIGRGARNTIDNLRRGAVIAGGLIAANVAIGVRSLAELEEANAQTAAGIESTGGVANVTAEHIRDMSEALETQTTIDDKLIQRSQNILLTFTNIRNEVGKGNDVFDQASKSLLDLAIRMHTGPEQAALQLGKALNDPVRGLTALRRVGIQFTEQQETQIKRMVESGRVMDAQKVILAELTKEFGGSAEAFSKGPGATLRRFEDAVEEAQQALATGFLPLMERVADMAQETFNDPKVIANITKFGSGLAGGLDDLIDIALKLPWKAIGSSLEVAGTASKALLSVFTSMPDWVQTAVLTGWGLNKLTGGALGSIAGELTKMAFGGLRGGTPATPVFTKEVGLGGTPGGPGGGVGVFGRALGFAGFIGLLAGAGIGLAELVRSVEPDIIEAKEKILAAGGPNAKLTTSQGAATPLGQFNAANQGGVPVKVTNTNSITDPITGGEDEATRAIRQDLAKLTLEQKLTRDATFKSRISSAEEFIRILRRTSEFGEKGVGTSIEQGRKTGRDPVGDAFVALINRLEKPALKSVVVQGEISRHITALEEVQGRLLKDGNIAEARHAQRNIDELHKILGTSDTTNALLRYLRQEQRSGLSEANRRLADGNARQQEIAQRVAESRAATDRGFQANNTQLGISNSRLSTIAAKDFSPNVNVTVPVTTNVSISDVVRNLSTYSVATSLSSQLRKGFTP